MAAKKKSPEATEEKAAATTTKRSRPTASKKSAATAKKTAARKTTSAAKSAPRKTAAKKTAASKTTSAAKSAPRKTAAEKSATAKAPAKKSAPKAPKNAPVKATTAKPAPKKKAHRASKAVARPVAGLEFDAMSDSHSSENLVMQVRTHQFEIEPAGESHAQVFPQPDRELPQSYDETQVTLLVRDPEWVFAFWEVSGRDRQRNGVTDGNLVLRLYDVTDVEFDGTNAHSQFDIAVGGSSNWYVRVPDSDRQWLAELGRVDTDGAFTVLARSNAVATPRSTVSPHAPSEEWMTVETDFERLFELSGGRVARGSAGTSEAAPALRRVEFELPRLEMGSEQLASGAMMGRELVAPERGFRLNLSTELIVYGATEPDATVTIQGHPVRLNPDGTFRLRLALPDGEQTIGVRAVSADGEESREITPVVSRHTR
jgi:hypothetical protein